MECLPLNENAWLIFTYYFFLSFLTFRAIIIQTNAAKKLEKIATKAPLSISNTPKLKLNPIPVKDYRGILS